MPTINTWLARGRKREKGEQLLANYYQTETEPLYMRRKRYMANWNKENGRKHESRKHTVGMKGREYRNKRKNQKDDAQQYNLPNQLPVHRRVWYAAWCSEVRRQRGMKGRAVVAVVAIDQL